MAREPWPLAWMQSVFGSGNPYAQGMKLMQETAQAMQARMGLPTGEKAGQMNPPGVTQNPKP
jgi:pyruvate/2-oxoacid:ferredoxin oxidoreductase beta subunit